MQTTTPLTHSALHIIHKYIRAQLFEMANALARADNQDLAEVQRQLENTAALLRGHGSHEDQAFESVLRAYDPLLANTLEDDHLKLEAALQRILTSAGQLDTLPDAQKNEHLQYLYLDWNQFVGHYLLHLDDEERLLFVAIREHMPEIDVIRASMATLEKTERLAFIEALKNITNRREQTQIFTTARHNEEPA